MSIKVISVIKAPDIESRGIGFQSYCRLHTDVNPLQLLPGKRVNICALAEVQVRNNIAIGRYSDRRNLRFM